MTNKEIAGKIKLLADLMELHEENAFRVKSYANAYLSIRKFPKNLTESSETEIASFPGLGKSLAQKIVELINTGTIADLEEMLKKTPDGVTAMLQVKGLGPKKVRLLWKGELAIEDTAELYQACLENRLIKLSGFGSKTQEDIKQKLQFHFSSRGKFHLATIWDVGLDLIQKLRSLYPSHRFEPSGEFRRKLPVVDGIEILADLPSSVEMLPLFDAECDLDSLFYKEIPVNYVYVTTQQFFHQWFCDSASPDFINALDVSPGDYGSEEEIFEQMGLPYVVSEFREMPSTIDLLRSGRKINLIEEADIKGLIHNHSTYSDGVNSIVEMVMAARERGYEYLVITDHSASAFYANGLKVERVLDQWAEIEAINQNQTGFRVVKGIESDILNDGRLDYADEILSGFEIVIASIHSNLRMDKEKATARLIKAIENKFTHILGHPTGRLLLGRKGYEIDHIRIIDACAANGVAIELNANPLRMDLDWTYIPMALEKGVKICISPDAHSIAQFDFVKPGIFTARKGGLTASECLNNLSVQDLVNWANMKN